MKDPELDILIKELETARDISVAEFDGVVYALAFLLPGVALPTADQIGMTDQAILVADAAYPNWSIHIRGRANDRDGHWHCTLRESESRDRHGNAAEWRTSDHPRGARDDRIDSGAVRPLFQLDDIFWSDPLIRRIAPDKVGIDHADQHGR